MKYFSRKVIRKDFLLSNYKTLKKISGTNICAVVKANAYSHGDQTVCKILKEDCNFFAVQNLEEAIKIRKVNKTAIILILGYCVDYNKAIKNNISVTIDNLIELNKIIKLNKKINIHIKINSGMNRLGIRDRTIFLNILNILKINKNIIFQGIYTHFFNINNNKIINNQYLFFEYFLKLIPDYFSPIIHIGGSGMIEHTKPYVNYVRCGLMLYGYGNEKLQKVLSVESKILKITEIGAGEFVGYDSHFVSSQKMKIAIVPLGYADGISQVMQDELFVTINNCKCRVVGKICMDMFMCDVTTVCASVGDSVQVFGDANYWAKLSNRSVYEVLTSLNKARLDLHIV